jgi:4-coumarate--CoA ligase
MLKKPWLKVIFINPNTPRPYKFLDVKEVAISFGHALRTEWNWAKGDVVAWYSPNSIDTPALNFGVLWAGGVV